MAVIRRTQEALDRAQQERLERRRDAVRRQRAAAFAQQSDPLIGKLLRGEITQAEFQSVAESIRAANPYPEDE